MDAKELMIGNYVFVDNERYHPEANGKIYEIVLIDNTRCEGDIDKCVVGLNSLIDDENIMIPLKAQFIRSIKPIPLTEDWLLSFYKDGFYKDKKSIWYFTHNELTLELEKYEDEFIVRFEYPTKYDSCYQFIRKIKYVHTFQNLIFALTGKQLTK